MFKFYLLFILLLFSFPARMDSSPPTVTPYRLVALREGPGQTYPQVAFAYAGTEMQLIERNHTGTWVFTRRVNNLDQVIEGWMLSGYLNWTPDIKFSEIPVNTALHDADTSRLVSRSLVRIYNVPVIPEISSEMRELYLRGQELGNHSNVVTKIGDSVSADPQYLNPMSRADYDLGPYDYLEETILYFGASTAEGSIAARIGLNSVVLFDPFWATDSRCNNGETPLECEYRLKKPSIALIMFGGNDMKLVNTQLYKEQIREAIEISFEHGIIPVLSTYSVADDSEYRWQGINNNIALIELAEEYHVPLINFYTASRVLPNDGLEIDNVHFTHSGFENLRYTNGQEAWYGTSLQNLLTIRMLDEIRRTVGMGAIPRPSRP